MNEMILTMLQSILILAVALLTVYALKWLTANTNQAKTVTNNYVAEKYIDEAKKAITDAISATSQTYTDELKKSGTFSKENQKIALGKAIDSAKAQMSKGAEEFLQTAYTDVNKYLEEKIEAEIKELSKAQE